MHPERKVAEYTKGWQTHFATAFFVALLLILTSISISNRRDIGKEFWLANTVQRNLRSPDLSIAFDGVATVEQLRMFLNSSVQVELFGHTVMRDNNYINKLRIRALRTKSYPCETDSTAICYYKEYNTETASIFFELARVEGGEKQIKIRYE